MVERRYKFLSLGLLAVLAIPGALWWRQSVFPIQDTSNYELEYPELDGWVEGVPGLQTIFVYRHPGKNLMLKAAQNQIVHDSNPTPELDREGLALRIANITKENLGWKVEMLDIVEGDGTSYRLIRRETSDRTVVVAVAVKGNTTILVTLAGVGKGQANVDAELPTLRKFLASTALVKPLIYDH